MLDFLDPVQQPAARSMAAMIGWRKFGLRCVIAFEHSGRMRHANQEHCVLAGFSSGLVEGTSRMLLEHVVNVLHACEITLANAIQSLV